MCVCMCVWCVHVYSVCVCLFSSSFKSSFGEIRNAFYVYVCTYYFCAPSVFTTNVYRVYFVHNSSGSGQINRLSSFYSLLRQAILSSQHQHVSRSFFSFSRHFWFVELTNRLHFCPCVYTSSDMTVMFLSQSGRLSGRISPGRKSLSPHIWLALFTCQVTVTGLEAYWKQTMRCSDHAFCLR